MHGKVLGRCSFLSFLTACIVCIQTSAANAQVVEAIRVEGTQRIEDATIQSYMLIKEGDELDTQRVNKSLKGLFATGLFSDVRIRRDGNDLVVKVVENPVVNRVAFEGNNRISDDELNGEVSVRPRSIYTRTRILADVQRLQEIYRRSGRYAATVEPKVIQQDQNRVDVVFEVNEGPITYVNKISFNGNKKFPDSELRDRILTKEEAWFRVLSGNDTYDPQRLAFDKEKLRRFYLSRGYADFELKSAIAELSVDRESFFLNFTIHEGERYSVRSIKVESSIPEIKDTSVLEKKVTFEPETWYDADAVEDTVQALTDGVGELGYAFVDIRPEIKKDSENKTLDIVFRINEGARVYVNRIEINGNVRTMDEVIRREFRLVEGDPFNSAKIRQTRRRLQGLGFFKAVDIKTEQSPTNPEEVTLKVNVEEQSTGEVMIGAGYSNADGAKITFGVSERNFLGKGQKLKLNLGLAESGTEIDASFTEPYFLDRELSAGVDLFRITKDLTDESSYDSESTGFALRMGYKYSEHLRHSWRYTLRQDEITDVDSDASLYIKEQEGTSILSSLGHILTYDRRNDFAEPTEGYFLRLENELAGFGGDARFFKTNVSASQYFNIADGYVLNASGYVGYMFGLGEDIAVNYRYFNGGEKKVRGFAASGISPRDKATGDALGGNWTTYESLELKFPLGLPQELGLSASTFVDMGSIGEFDNLESSDTDHNASIRMSVGLGFIWKSPMGPMNLAFSLPFLKEDYDETESVQFNLGTRF